MTAFRRLIRLPSFKDSFGSLLQVNESDLHIMLDEINRAGNDPEHLDDVPEELSDPYSALLAVRAMVGEGHYDDVMSDIRAAYPDSEAVERLAHHFVPTQGEIDARAIREAETETLPIVLDMKVSLDYRVSITNKGETRLVPVFIARVTFDEPVGGSDTVTFQVSPFALRRLRQDIGLALDLLNHATKSLDPRLLYEATIKKHLDGASGGPAGGPS